MSDHTNDNIFKDMREQMTPSAVTMERLATALETESAQGVWDPVGTSAASGGPVGAPFTQNASDAASAAPVPPLFAAAGSRAPRASHAASTARRRRRRFAAYFSTATAAVLVLIAVTFTLVTGNLPFAGTSLGALGNGRHDAVANVGAVRAPASYDELYGVLVDAGGSYAGSYEPLLESVEGAEAAAGEVNTSAPSADVGAATAAEPVEAPVPQATPMPQDTAQDVAVPTMMEPSKEVAGSPASSSALDTSASPASSDGYSETNVQVQGIDEGDIVKTDGSNIYALSHTELVIFKADGADTSELSRTQIAAQDESKEAAGQLRWYYYENPVELFINGSMLIAVINVDSYGANSSSSNSSDTSDTSDTSDSSGASSSDMAPTYDTYGAYGSQNSTRLAFYDISDPTSPRLVEQFSQSGSYNTARLDGTTLYLISSYYLYRGIDGNDPITYVPLLGEGASVAPMAVADIRIMPTVDSTNYTVVTSYDVAGATRTDQKSVLGNAETVYMSHDNLYLGSSVWVNENKEPYQESVYTVYEHVSQVSTQLVRIAVDGGALTVTAQCTVGGQLLNQFSLDEYEGNLRLAVTHNDYSYRVYKDPRYDVESYQNGVTNNTNSLLVLNSALNVIGSIEGLAADERIYSVRFTGPVGYMVTYRQVDPLFALDLADPTNPRVTSELKIPGFSTYLHPFTEGRLLGLGYDAEGVRQQGMKMSMFDIADPFAVGERHTVSVETYYSDALSNHKAVLVDASRDLIGFHGTDWASNVPAYFVYGYDDASGFVLKAKLALDTEGGYYYSGGGTRGLYIGDYLYVYTGISLHVFDLESFEGVGFIEVRDPSQPYYGYSPGFIVE
ncbi:MAG: beta-propeller domain-containing protein [Coriobacteriales bacterium]|jgi:uncharacterized secreted protein with C-terminal beta-propeller domain|nr:beta-propeller domain-containing protein [Coriobacteriales bacterium]